ncbi:MAG: hypothetical protein LBT29_00840 [Flavobacteriaceae bacterium]|nr:hypothetical protein [Flavobacteriaceae bacterium]
MPAAREFVEAVRLAQEVLSGDNCFKATGAVEPKTNFDKGTVSNGVAVNNHFSTTGVRR